MDDKFHRNAKVRALKNERNGRAALGTWVIWWSWCLDEGQDGAMMDPSRRGYVAEMDLTRSEKRHAELLVRHRLWVKTDGGFLFKDFDEWNPNPAKREAKRQADRERMAAKRAESRARHRGDIASESLATSQGCRTTPLPIPKPNPSYSATGATSGADPEASEWAQAIAIFEEAWSRHYTTELGVALSGNAHQRGTAVVNWGRSCLGDNWREAVALSADRFAASDDSQNAKSPWALFASQAGKWYQPPGKREETVAERNARIMAEL